MYFKEHAYLDDLTNIPRKLNAMCITRQTARYDVTAVGPISEETCDK